MGLIAFLLGVYLIARIVKTAFGSGVKVTTYRRTLPDGQVVTDTTEQIVATKIDRWIARIVLGLLAYGFAVLTYMLQLWSF